MDLRPIEFEWSDEMSVETVEPLVMRGSRYPMRLMARVFGTLGAAAVVYAGVLVVIAFEAAIIEF